MRIALSALLAATALLTACGGDPLAEDAESYHAQLAPTMVQNMELAKQFLDIAARIKKEEMGGDDVLRRWEKRIIPLADSLQSEAQAVEPATPELQALHAELVEAWTARADSYRAMHKAYRDDDPDGFSAAAEANKKSKITEEAYFRKVNATLGAYGFHLDQFPE
ncbi:MAG: hypothetical protein H6740_01540 [Alphaproteobacteria bacterium]|nr:hypothetical protein [Alphaproteobacteria bacterium]